MQTGYLESAKIVCRMARNVELRSLEGALRRTMSQDAKFISYQECIAPVPPAQMPQMQFARLN